MPVEFIQTLTPVDCAECCMTFGVPPRLIDDRKIDGKAFHCPNGHVNTYGEGTNARLARELNAAKMREQAERDQRWAAELERDKLKKRTSKGACPCCKRHFRELQRHMESKHPEFAKK